MLIMERPDCQRNSAPDGRKNFCCRIREPWDILFSGDPMDYGLIKASQRLSELELKILIDGYVVNVYWFRVMFKEHEWLIRRHAHSTFEFHFIARGDCEVILDDRSFIAPAGTFFLSAPDVYHTQRPGTLPELVEYSLNCDIRKTAAAPDGPSDMIGWLRKVFLSTPPGLVPDSHGAIALFDAALREADRRLPCFEMMVRTLVPMILVAAARAMDVPETVQADAELPEDADRTEIRMARIEQFVLDNIKLDLSPADIAGHLNLSERQVGRVVMAARGYSTKKLITRIKLKRAKALLCTTTQTLKEIASELGFANEYYFNTVFRKHEGFPPGMFRESMRRSAFGQEPGGVSGNDMKAMNIGQKVGGFVEGVHRTGT